MLLVYQLSLWMVVIISFVGLRYFFGTRIYYREGKYITVREVVLPLLFVLFESSSKIIFGYSWFWQLLLLCSLMGVGLLYHYKIRGIFRLDRFLHHYCSLVFLLVSVAILLLQFGRF